METKYTETIRNAYEAVREKVETGEKSLARLVLEALDLKPQVQPVTIANCPRVLEQIGTKYEW
ncbi:hypothetical protein HOD88_00040 [archaeon]|jgi:hypothetical protein|nr:hypothetical protein [archaeon]